MVTQQQRGAMCQTVRMGMNCENTLSGRSQKRRAAHHGISFLWNIENEQVQRVRRDYLLFARDWEGGNSKYPAKQKGFFGIDKNVLE